MTVYEIVTEKIVAALDAGVVPWHKPWSGGVSGNANFKTKHVYTGVNQMLTAIAGYACPYWLTYKQAASMGGQVRKGEKGTLITFWKIWDREVEGKEKKVPVFRYFTVFNLEQIDGIEWEQPAAAEHADPIAEAQQIVDAYHGPVVKHASQDRAFYRPDSDTVMMPQIGQFESREAYHQTLFHELVHSTGHESRLERGIRNGFGDNRYAREELVAEIGAAMLMASAGLEPRIEESAAYIASWKRRLQEDPKLIVTAASAGQKAVEFITHDSEAEKQVA